MRRLLTVALVLAACWGPNSSTNGSDSVQRQAGDAGTATSGGAPDAGAPSSDAGGGYDAGATFDAGSAASCDQVSDPAAEPDAGPPPDKGVRYAAGPSPTVQAQSTGWVANGTQGCE